MKPELSDDYFNEIAFRESGGRLKPLDSPSRYSISNEYNYLGKYQMGTAALVEAGFYQGKVYSSTQIYDDSKWSPLAKSLGVNSVNDFLKTPEAQEVAIRNFTYKQWAQLEALGLDKHLGSEINGVLITPEGLLAGAHLKGSASVQKFVLYGIDSKDANQTAVSSYMKIFDSRTEYPKVNNQENSWTVGKDVTIDLIAAATNSTIDQIRTANPSINVYALNQNQTLNLPSIQNGLISSSNMNDADTNNNQIPDILESKQKLSQSNKQHSENVTPPSHINVTQDQIIAKFVMQKLQDALERGDALPSIHHTQLQSEIS